MATDITDKYIRIRVASPVEFEDDSFRTIIISNVSSIKAVIGRHKSNSKVAIQSYLFDRDKWTVSKAKNWVKKNRNSNEKASIVIGKPVIGSSAILCASLPRVIHDHKEVLPLDKNVSLASLNDLYYMYTEPVHEGKNKNGTVFTQEEIVKSYRSFFGKPIDWEHMRELIIGFSINPELVYQPDQPLTIGYTGILNRLSPYMMQDNRDEIIRNRYFKGQLFTSMECLFDSFKCEACGQSARDWIEFDQHVRMFHQDILAQGDYPGHVLVGVDFVGTGIVETPADPEADIMSLRTSDEGDLAVSIKDDPEMASAFAGYSDKFGSLADMFKGSYCLAYAIPHAVCEAKAPAQVATIADVQEMIDSASQIFKQLVTESTKIEENHDKINSEDKGGQLMSNFKERLASCVDMQAAMVAVESFLVELKEINETQAKEMVTELTTFINSIKEAELAAVKAQFENDIKTISESKGLVESEASLKDSIASELTEKLTASEAKVTELETKVVELTETVSSLNDSIESAKAEAANAEREAKINESMAEVKSVMEMTPSFEAHIRNIISAKINDAATLKEFIEDCKVNFERERLINASANNGTSFPAGAESTDLRTSLTNVRNKYKK